MFYHFVNDHNYCLLCYKDDTMDVYLARKPIGFYQNEYPKL